MADAKHFGATHAEDHLWIVKTGDELLWNGASQKTAVIYDFFSKRLIPKHRLYK